MFNDQRNLFRPLLPSHCQRKPSGGDVAAPVNRTKGPAVARDYYPLECAAATAAALPNEMEEGEGDGNFIGLFCPRRAVPGPFRADSSDVTLIMTVIIN